jgi:hypothetical protein
MSQYVTFWLCRYSETCLLHHILDDICTTMTWNSNSIASAKNGAHAVSLKTLAKNIASFSSYPARIYYLMLTYSRLRVIQNTLTPLGRFDTNYIIFRNVENFKSNQFIIIFGRKRLKSQECFISFKWNLQKILIFDKDVWKLPRYYGHFAVVGGAALMHHYRELHCKIL